MTTISAYKLLTLPLCYLKVPKECEKSNYSGCKPLSHCKHQLKTLDRSVNKYFIPRLSDGSHGFALSCWTEGGAQFTERKMYGYRL